MAAAIINRVRELRLEADLTQQGLADAIGVSRQTVNAIETGRYTPSLDVALRISKVFAHSTDDVFRLPECE